MSKPAPKKQIFKMGAKDIFDKANMTEDKDSFMPGMDRVSPTKEQVEQTLKDIQNQKISQQVLDAFAEGKVTTVDAPIDSIIISEYNLRGKEMADVYKYANLALGELLKLRDDAMVAPNLARYISDPEIRKQLSRVLVSKEVVDLIELAGSIQALGMTSYPLARFDNGKFIVPAGARRYYSHLLLNRPTMTLIVVEDLNELEIVIAENLLREDIKDWEDGRLMVMLQEKRDMTQEEIAAALSISQPTVSRKIKAYRDYIENKGKLKERPKKQPKRQMVHKTKQGVEVYLFFDYQIKDLEQQYAAIEETYKVLRKVLNIKNKS